jgi:hypothetical protein
MRHTPLLGLAALLLLPTALTAQAGRPTLELRGVAMTPTFGIADNSRVGANIGAGFGAGIGVSVAPRVRLMADFDAGFHGSEIGDVTTYHYLGKVGFDVTSSGRVRVTLNAGAGMVSIKPKGASALNYFAINAGAKIGVGLSDRIEFLLSPQGDIAFSKKSEVLTSKSWIWPIGAGLRFAL